MLVRAAMGGAKRCSSNASSCQLEISITTGVVGVIRTSWASAETPIFPAKTVDAFQAESISAQRVAVVVLPLVPVMPTIGAGQSRKKRLISISTGTPVWRAICKKGDE